MGLPTSLFCGLPDLALFPFLAFLLAPTGYGYATATLTLVLILLANGLLMARHLLTEPATPPAPAAAPAAAPAPASAPSPPQRFPLASSATGYVRAFVSFGLVLILLASILPALLLLLL